MPFLNTILDIIFPVYCVSCGGRGSYFCLECLSGCPLAEREGQTWIFPLFDYKYPPIKKSLSLFKYKNKKKLSSTFAEMLYGKILEELSDLSVMENFRDAILIPIPLSAKRYRERGYNQAELICRELIKLDNDQNFKLQTGILVKPKETGHQARIKNRSERLKNIISSFTIKDGTENLIKNKNIILIDDILTTGATLAEARKILKQSGAGKIIAFTIAH
ncbi:MAG TPA: phosphoribosyltransferase family protein [Candidatus Paceibacterota bacterium]|jgi:ComF family protein|nr:phosphoribosyltransferase family protein [Candidatus Paceibacterota bacterium]